jgi:hypothetical protein
MTYPGGTVRELRQQSKERQMKAMAENFLSDEEVAAANGVTPATNRYHRQRGTRRRVAGTLTGIDNLGRVWIKLGRSVWYSKGATQEHLEAIARKAMAGGR